MSTIILAGIPSKRIVAMLITDMPPVPEGADGSTYEMHLSSTEARGLAADLIAAADKSEEH